MYFISINHSFNYAILPMLSLRRLLARFPSQMIPNPSVSLLLYVNPCIIHGILISHRFATAAVEQSMADGDNVDLSVTASH
ncbi:hypothetical protein Y032_0283g1334 [Ancylostoma ceylanicum]|uniref:Uncharacterized protein n=1 Tax=Ancylostoma ceylanicum TaxID=53326 RepID=A0A016S7B0_9BILA|nr:hypothetical protein Y032_0283g1334 [Ancylostoma ceylanicum]